MGQTKDNPSLQMELALANFHAIFLLEEILTGSHRVQLVMGWR